MLGAHPFRLARVGLAGRQFVHPQVAVGMPVDLAAGAAIDDHALHRFAAPECERLVGDALERQCLAAACLLVGRDQRRRADVDEPLVQRLRGEAAEHDRVRRADAGAGLHRDDAFDRHRDIDDDAVALADAALLQRIRETRHAGEEIRIGDARDGTVVGFEDHRDALAVAGFDVTVEAVVRRVQLAVVEPLVERRVGLVEHFGERLVPREAFAREARPEAFVIALGLGDERPIGRHAGNGRRLLKRRGRRKLAGFVKNRFNRRHRQPLGEHESSAWRRDRARRASWPAHARRCLLPTTRARPEGRCAMLRRTTSHDGDRATRQCPQ
ncbi:hypothetical protein L810_3706 [Burkholderia sp. AU4i]|nr:hypothetical protein L810_3706 [Burkholderia sp. AU4i]